MFFPEKVYHCDCLANVIASCLTNQVLSLTGICEKVNEIDGRKIYCVRCGENNQHIVLSCREHMPMVIFAYSPTPISISDETEKCCLIRIKKYLEKNYHIFGHENFKKN